MSGLRWSTEGCVTIREEGGDAYTCSCDHLTEFIVFEFPTSGDELLATAYGFKDELLRKVEQEWASKDTGHSCQSSINVLSSS